MSFEFFLTSLIVVLLPGTGVLYTIAIGLSGGFRSSLAAAFGCTLGILPAAIASIIGLAAVLHTSALTFEILKYFGVAYLIYMAFNMVKDGGPLEISQESAKHSALKTISTGMLLNVLNPKLSLFFMAFLPQFVPAGSVGATTQMILLAAVFMALTFMVFIGYGAFATLTRDYVISRPTVMKWVKRSFAASFGLLGLKLALSEN